MKDRNSRRRECCCSFVVVVHTQMLKEIQVTSVLECSGHRCIFSSIPERKGHDLVETSSGIFDTWRPSRLCQVCKPWSFFVVELVHAIFAGELGGHFRFQRRHHPKERLHCCLEPSNVA